MLERGDQETLLYGTAAAARAHSSEVYLPFPNPCSAAEVSRFQTKSESSRRDASMNADAVTQQEQALLSRLAEYKRQDNICDSFDRLFRTPGTDFLLPFSPWAPKSHGSAQAKEIWKRIRAPSYQHPLVHHKLSKFDKTQQRVKLLKAEAKTQQQTVLRELKDLWQKETERLALLERTYEYEPLQSPTNFRLLKLYGADNASASKCLVRLKELFGRESIRALVCSLEIFDPGGSGWPSFEALSYEWYPPNVKQSGHASSHRSSQTLVVQQGTGALRLIEISSNLFQFLSDIQQKHDDCWVWADAVCIDQSSNEERGHQVKLMGEIYSQAFKVLIWLPVDNPRLAAAALRWLISQTPNANASQGNYHDVLYLDHDVRAFLLDGVFASSYWTRKWIIQEVILARSVVAMVGKDEFAIQTLEDALNSESDLYAAGLSSRPMATLTSHRRQRLLGENSPRMLCDLIDLYQGNKYGELRDHVYALYNLIGEHRRHLNVDYEQTQTAMIENVFDFLEQYEPPSAITMVYTTAILHRLLLPGDAEFRPSSVHGCTGYSAIAYQSDGLHLTPECDRSVNLRGIVTSLHPGLTWTLVRDSASWIVDQKSATVKQERTSTRTMDYFEIAAQQICGLASVRVRNGDRVWRFLKTNLAFIVRDIDCLSDEPKVLILGRCYVFKLGDAARMKQAGYSVLTSDRTQDFNAQDMRLDLPDLWTLSRCASIVDLTNPL